MLTINWTVIVNVIYLSLTLITFSLHICATAAHFHHVIELLRFRQGTVSGIFLSAGNTLVSLLASLEYVVLLVWCNYAYNCYYLSLQCSSFLTQQYLEPIQPLYSSEQVHLQKWIFSVNWRNIIKIILQ